MSVALKLADKDAAFIGRILKDVADLQEAVLAGKETVHLLKAIDREISSSVMVGQTRELASALLVAVRANVK